MTFVLTLTPPSAADYDSLTYHLAAPRQYLIRGRITELPYDHHSYFPFTMEMLYLFGLSMRGPVLAKLFHWLMLPLSCAALVAMGRRHLSLRAGLFGAALFASLPVVQAEASTAYIDLGLTAFTLLAFLCMANWLSTRDGWWLVWSGVFAAFCMGTKYLGVLTFGWLLAWAIGRMLAQRKLQVKPLATCAVWAVVLGGGWYVRNWYWTGNPVFPFAYEIFDGRGWSLDMAKAYTADQLKYGFGRTLIDWLWLSWRMAMTPLNALVYDPVAGFLIMPQPFWPWSSQPLNNPAQLGLFETPGNLSQTVLGPALLAFGAPLVLIRRKPSIVGFILWSFAFFSLFWCLTGQYLRYLIPAFALLCLACGWGVCRYLQASAVLKWTTAGVLVLWFALTPALTLWNARRSFAVIAGRETPAEYLARTFPGYEAMSRASTNTPRTARFAVYGEPRTFYLEREYFWADDPHNNLIDYSRVKTGAYLVRVLQSLG
ncbi:MAG: glycosyltransferase family 39 protein, partial [Armatimonadota bacterium]|nr:glycosyltransferase family 39 protein [Armatimonadota bacterium]